MFFHLGKRCNHPLATKGGPNLGGERSKKRELICYLLIQQMFIECLLCARNCLQLFKKKKMKISAFMELTSWLGEGGDGNGGQMIARCINKIYSVR